MTTFIVCVALLILGAFSIADGVFMKTKSRIPKWMLKGVEVKPDSNTEGFINSMWYKNIFAGVILITYGAYRLATCYITELVYNSMMMWGLLIFLLAYMMLLTNAKREFFGFTQ